MTTLSLDSSNNLIAGTSFVTLSGNKAIIQNIKTKLNFFKGECIFDTSLGIDYLNLIYENDKNNLKNTIIENVKEIDGVSEVEITEFSIENSKLTIALQITTDDGDVINV